MIPRMLTFSKCRLDTPEYHAETQRSPRFNFSEFLPLRTLRLCVAFSIFHFLDRPLPLLAFEPPQQTQQAIQDGQRVRRATGNV